MFTSLDGSRWTEAPVPLDGVTASSRNAAADISGCAVAGGSSTGNGFITFDATVGDEGAYAESFGSAPCGVAPPAGGTCPTQLRVGIAQLIATHGCFAAGRSGTYSTSKPVELNGLTLTPVHGAIVIDTANHTIGAGSSPVTVSVASVVLGSQPIDWLVPATSGPMRDLRNHGRPASVAPSTRRSTMLGYAFGGVVIPVLGSGGAARIPVNVKMPSPIGGFIGPAPTDDVTIHAGNAILGGASLSPGSLQIKIPVVSLGIAELAPFELDFDADPEVFDGRFGLVLPVVDTAIVSHFRFQQGHFVEGDAAADFRNSLPLYPDVFLQKVNLQVAGKRGNPCASPASNSNGPTSIGGGVTLAIGPQIGGTSLMDVDGEAAYAFPEASCHQPGLFTITGTGSVLGTKVGNAHASFATNGDINLGASVSVGGECLSATVGFDSAISPTPPISFYAEAHARINVLCASFPGTTVYISTHGIRACVLKGTFTYHWGSLLPSFGFGDCGAGDFASAASAMAAASNTANTAITVPRHAALEDVLLHGFGGAPLATLTGPGGQQVTASAPPPGQPAA